MTLHELTLHKLQKEQNGVATLELRTKPYKVTHTEQSFITEAKEVYYQKSNPNFGVFETDDISYPYQKLVKDYLDKKDDFLTFTSKAMNVFKSIINKEPQATGGAIVFAHYTVNAEDFLLVMMLNSKKKYNVNADLGLYDVSVLDIEKLDLANNLNISKWINNDETYLSFAKGRKEISKYFRSFIGCTDQTSAKESSKALKVAVLDYISELDLKNDEKEDLRNKVFNYCLDKIKKKEDIPLSHISSILNENEPEAFTNFAASEKYRVSSLVKGHKQTLKSLKFYVYRSKKLTIEFDSSIMNETIFYNANKNELRIKNVPDDLKRQLTNTDQ